MSYKESLLWFTKRAKPQTDKEKFAYNWHKSELNDLIKRETPKDVVHNDDCWVCPKCSLVVSLIDRGVDNDKPWVKYETPTYCKWCGQKLDWSNANEKQ